MSNSVIQGTVKSLILTDLECKQVNSGEFRISGYASKPVVDRVGDIVDVSAFQNTLEEFKSNPVMLWMHDATEPIGQWDHFELRSDGLYVSGTLVAGTSMAEKARTLISHKAVRALSIGFREIDGGPEEDGHYHIRRLRLFEISVVSVPANQSALFTLDGGKCIGVELVGEEDEPVKQTLEIELKATDPDGKPIDFEQLALAAAAASNEELIAGLNKAMDALEQEVKSLQETVTSQARVIEQLEQFHDGRLTDLEKCIIKLVKGNLQRLEKTIEAKVA